MFKVPAILTRFSTRVDGGAGVSFSTSELDDKDFLAIKMHHNKHGWLVFSENQIQETDIPKNQAEAEAKTPSQRLRSVIFLYWKQKGGKGDFETFYRKNMERLIGKVTVHLDD